MKWEEEASYVWRLVSDDGRILGRASASYKRLSWYAVCGKQRAELTTLEGAQEWVEKQVERGEVQP
jgi:hypothetical protein